MLPRENLKLRLRVLADKQQSLNTRLQTLSTRLQTPATRSQTLSTRQTSQTRMSSGKWQTINGVRYPVEDYGWEAPKQNSFTHNGKTWDVVRELTLEEATAIAGNQPRDWAKATDEELMVHTFGYGESRMNGALSKTIVVKLDDEKTMLPFGLVDTAPLLELIWRKTGADCPEEEADLELPSGTYHILLQE